MKTAFAVLAATVAVTGSAFAADLPARKGALAAPPSTLTYACSEENGVPTDIFGFTTGSDVTGHRDIGATITANGNFSARSTRLSAVTGVAQLAFGAFPCVEIGPYAYLGGSSAKDKLSAAKGDSTVVGGGVEFKYKVLSRTQHGVGATVDLDVSTQGARLGGLLGAGSINTTAVAARLFLDRDFGGGLFGAINLEHISAFSRVAGVSLDGSQLNIRAALSKKIGGTNLYLGAEALYSRSYAGASYRTYVGDAFFVGPNLLWAINDKWTFNAAYQVQVAGKARNNPGDLNLISYNQHLARVKLGYSF
jgi:hypothetical protein